MYGFLVYFSQHQEHRRKQIGLPLSDFGCMLSVGTIRFEDRFCASKKGGIGGGGLVLWCRAHGSCLGWTISCLVSTNGLRNHFSSLVGALFLTL